MLNFLSKDFLFSLLFLTTGFVFGYIVKEYFFTKPCPSLTCPECPPSNVTNLIINNEKLKVKGNSQLDLTNILKDNQIIQQNDSLPDTKEKKRGVLKKLFSK